MCDVVNFDKVKDDSEDSGTEEPQELDEEGPSEAIATEGNAPSNLTPAANYPSSDAAIHPGSVCRASCKLSLISSLLFTLEILYVLLQPNHKLYLFACLSDFQLNQTACSYQCLLILRSKANVIKLLNVTRV